MMRKINILFLLSTFVASVISEQTPNIVLFLTDDQDVVLGGMDPMKNVQELIANKGVTFENSYTVSPVCCPSRASILTGMYPHNHKTYNNSLDGGCYGRQWKRYEQKTFATALQKAGYNTFYAGKYLNQYGDLQAGGPETVPSGWTEWHGLVGNSKYYNYTLSNNGVPTFSEDLYLTDVIRDLSISFIENQTSTKPFLLVLAPPAPHQPFTPAPRHEGKFRNVTAMRNPSFNYYTEDKHWLITMKPNPLPKSIMPYLDESYRLRWETLLAVDEMVADVVNKLEELSYLDNTFLIYTSDNGYHMGQFAQVLDKRQPYETDIKIPLVISGPGVRQNVTLPTPVLNIDLAPTILSMAGVHPPPSMDGREIDLTPGPLPDRYMLIEYNGEGSTSTNDADCPWSNDVNLSGCKNKYICKCTDARNNTYSCIRHIAERTNFKYCKFEKTKECKKNYACKCQDARNNTYSCIRHIAERTNFKYCKFANSKSAQSFYEIYDLNDDPHELTNSYYNTSAVVKEWYSLNLSKMSSCRGASNCDKPLPVLDTYTETGLLRSFSNKRATQGNTPSSKL